MEEANVAKLIEKPHPKAVRLIDDGNTLVWAAVISVEPATAQTWLAANKGNRKYRKFRAKRYADQMKAGHWRLTHQGIAFDETGTIIDGQHRLSGIVEAGVAQQMLVTWGWPSETKQVLDQGLNRTDTDVVNAETDAKVGFNELAGLKLFHFGVAGLRDFHAKILARQVLLDLIGKHREAIRFIQKHLLGTKKKCGCGRAAVTGAIMRAFYAVDRKRLEEFCTVLTSGEVQDPKRDRAAIKLRNLILETLGKTMAADRLSTYLKTEEAIRAFVAGEPVETLKEAKGELWPLPGETTQAAEPEAKQSPEPTPARKRMGVFYDPDDDRPEPKPRKGDPDPEQIASMKAKLLAERSKAVGKFAAQANGKH
jgi:hypothetical protein